MKTIVLPILILFLHTQSALGLEEDCKLLDQGVWCEFKGETGLELFEEIKLHQIQRQLVSLDDGWGSLFLVSKPYLLGWGTFSYCWGFNVENTHQVFLSCSNTKNFEDAVPELVEKQISSLR